MITRKQLFSFWPDVLGVGAIVLPFLYGVSPLEAFFIFRFSAFWQIWLLAAPLFLAIHIAVWQVLRVLRGIPTKTERVLAYALSTGAMLPPLIPTILIVGALLSRNEPLEDGYLRVVVMLVPTWTLVAANALLLLHNLKVAAPAEVTAGVFLVGGYLPNAIFCPIFLSGFSIYSWSWNIGAYFVFATCIGYVLRIISLMRHGTKGYRTEENPALAD